MFTNISENYETHPESRWMLNGIDLSAKLFQFGKKSLELHNKIDSISDLRLLALDHIYAFSQDIDESTTKFLGQELHVKVLNQLIPGGIEMFPPCNITNVCIKASQVKSQTPWMDRMKVASDIIDSTKDGNEEDVLFGSIIYKTITTMGSCPQNTDIEDTFVHCCTHDLLSSLFSCDQYFKQEWANASLETNKAYQSDWMTSVKIWRKKYNIVIAVAEPKSKQNRGIISDYGKLGRQLKLMLEELIKSGVEDPEVFGMLVRGSTLELYTMDVNYDGIYRFVEVDDVQLVSSYQEMINMIRTLPLLYKFKEKAAALVHRLEIVELEKSNGALVSPSVPTKWLRASADIKIKERTI